VKPLALAVVSLFSAVVLAPFAGCGGSSTSSRSDGGADGSRDANLDGQLGDSGDDGGACIPVSVGGYTPLPYVPAKAYQGVCSTADILTFLLDCVNTNDPTTCDNWFQTNLPIGGTGTACGTCIASPDNNGGIWADPNNIFYPNYGACIQVLDPIDGTACATALSNSQGCEGVACDCCADYGSCQTVVDRTVCTTYAAATASACRRDNAAGGAASTCEPSFCSGNIDDDFMFIINLICGTAEGGGADSGTADSGAADAGRGEGGSEEGGSSDAGSAQDGGAEGGSADGGIVDGGSADSG
jgi:hypothetical protein